ncbi:hypothetical protein GCM10011390_10270 [Aureimonas endophytica]|uniref:Uncharacterized protein n=1 Tax=Aureimonas endophytica TaxID=2027858 RepID=A0A916ZF26_9HYPH|nr:hypothetical protein [Aureimonas endophytica]GGD93441.1 hypothetical protein GCM10011390_10270 [Aureimonas endophytica]
MIDCLRSNGGTSMASAQLFLRGARVNRDFHAALLDAANRAGVTPNEFCITAAAEKLIAGGRRFSGVFQANDFDTRDVVAPAARNVRSA